MSELIMPSYIYTGKGALQEAAGKIRECGSKALIVTGPHVEKTVMMNKLKELLKEAGVDYQIFSQITGEPTDHMIETGIEICRSEKCDFCIGIGGGSPLDSAKAIAAMVGKEGKIADYCGRLIEGEVLPIVAIPTTAGTGSEATRFTVITDQEKEIKMLLRGEKLIPRIAIIDPEFSAGMPQSITASTGLDALTHAVEAYTSVKASPLTDDLASSAVRRIMKFLPRAYQNCDDAKAREQMAIASLEAGICINNSSVTLVHGMSRPIGALFHVPHGISNAMLLKECLTYALDGAWERFADLGRTTHAEAGTETDQAAAERFIREIGELLRICEIPSLYQYGINPEEFEKYIKKMSADAIASGSPGNTRKKVTENDCAAIYHKAFY